MRTFTEWTVLNTPLGEQLLRVLQQVHERIFIEFMRLDRKVKAFQRGLEMKYLRDLKDLVIAAVGRSSSSL